MTARVHHRRYKAWASALSLAAIVSCNGDSSSQKEDSRPEVAAALTDPAAQPRLVGVDTYLQQDKLPGVSPSGVLGDLPGVVTSVDERRGVPAFVWTPRLRPGRASSNPADAAIAHVETYARAYQLSSAAIDTIVVRRIHDIGRGGIVVELGQQIDGIDVYRDELNVMMTRDQQLVAMSGALHPAATPTLLRRNDMRFDMTADEAIAMALTDMYETGVDATDLAVAGERHGYGLFEPKTGSLVLDGKTRTFSRPARIKRVLYPLPRGLVPAYFVELEVGVSGSVQSDAYGYVVAAADGSVLMRQNLTVADSFTYTVWADADAPNTFADSPTEDTTPHPTPGPSGIEPGFVLPRPITIEGFNTNPLGEVDPWLAPDATETTGNNVDAYADHATPDGFGAGDTRADVTAPGVFDYTYDPTLEPLANETQIKASAVQMFYVINWLHNYFYDSGFNEAAGNAQTDNFGRGGLDGDPMLAEAQDTGGTQTNNANMQAFADGGSPRMQMYIFDLQTPNRDGSIDNGIITHEWGHYIHIRLANCGFSAQCGGMGEGWGDFLAVMMAMRDGDDYRGSFALAPYASAGIGSDATFFGIRRVAYSADFAVNAATFRMISDGQTFPPEMPLSDNGQPNSEVHNAGEIWGTMMQEVYVAILEDDRYDFSTAQRRLADYVVAGLIMTPPTATFTEARDAILAAAAANDTQDLVLIAQAFARRGMGTGAISPDRNSADLTGVVEDFDIKGSITFDGSSLVNDADCDGDGILDAGDTGQLTLEILNVGAADLANTTATITSSNPNVVFPDGPDIEFAPMGPFDTATATVPVALSAGIFGMQRLEATVEFTDPDAAITPVVAVINPRINADRGPSTLDDIEAEATDWTVESSFDSWQRAEELSGNTRWRGEEPQDIGDEMLVTPAAQVSATDDLVVTYQHRHQFASLDLFGLFELKLGGGVVEYSTDDGGSWADISDLADPGYDDALTPFISDNPLAGQQAYTASNPANPAMDTVSLNLGTSLAGQMVMFRFRLTSAGGVAAPGWEVDEVGFEGIDNTPFSDGPIDDGGCADPTAPVANAGPDQSVDEGAVVVLDASGSSDPGGDPLTYSWVQLDGPSVTLSDDAAEMPEFTAPDVTGETALRFGLFVEAGGDTSAPDTVDITVADLDVPDEPDAGVPPADEPDAMPPADEPDAGSGPPADDPNGEDDSGCGCQTGSTGSGQATGLVLMLAFGLIAFRRRRS